MRVSLGMLKNKVVGKSSTGLPSLKLLHCFSSDPPDSDDDFKKVNKI